MKCVPKYTPFMACTATQNVRHEVMRSLEMVDCEFVSTSPDRPNIFSEHALILKLETFHCILKSESDGTIAGHLWT